MGDVSHGLSYVSQGSSVLIKANAASHRRNESERCHILYEVKVAFEILEIKTEKQRDLYIYIYIYV